MQEDLKRIHEASMKILEEVGVRFYHPKVLDLLQKKGVKVVGETAFFKQDQIMNWVGKAPSLFKIYARNHKYDMIIGGDAVEYVSCNSGFPWIADFEGTRRKAVLQDYLTFVKLVHQTSFFKINGGVMVTPSDLSYSPMYPYMLYIALSHSDKCMFGGIGGARESEMIMDMLQIVFGKEEELVNKPRIATIISPLSPLQFDRTMLDTLLVYAQYGQPMIISPAVMAGSTGPVTLAGTIALANAETLAGVVVSQMVREGTPVIYGSASSASDMKTLSFSIGSPESALCTAYCARLSKAYGLPCRAGGALNDAKSISVQAGYESMMVMLIAAQEKTNFILHCAGSLDSYGAMSFEKYIVDLEIVGMVDRYIQDVKMDQIDLALDIINQVGPGGEFITHPHTMKFCRTELWSPEISLRGSIKDKRPDESFKENINKKKLRMLEDYTLPALPTEVETKLTAYIKNSGIDVPLIK